MNTHLPQLTFDVGGPAPSRLLLESQPFLLSANSERAYRSDFAHYETWCSEHQADPFSDEPDVLLRYLSDHAGELSNATLRRRIAAIRFHYEYAMGIQCPVSLSDPRIAKQWKAICRLPKNRPKRRARPLSSALLRRVIRAMYADPLPSKVSGWRRARDRAILCVGFAGGLRRSEIVALQEKDLSFEREGLLLRVGSSKTDQMAEGIEVGLRRGQGLTCPVGAVKDWLAIKSHYVNHVFPSSRFPESAPLTPRSVGNILLRRMEEAGLSTKGFSAHSLRAGMITEAKRAGASEYDIARVSRHKSLDVLRSYIRELDPWVNNPTDKLGL